VRLVPRLLAGLLLSVSAAAADWPPVALEPRLAGLQNPTHVTGAGDGSGRLFVVLQRGEVRVARKGVLLDAPFLDISARVSCCFERGLLSVAFSPRFAATGAFSVDSTDVTGDTNVARYRVSANPDLADPSSEEIVLHGPQPFPNHNGGQLAFGPDGFLYVGMGDGGSGGDPFGNGQNTNVRLGKVLRIDVESETKPYAIPPANPFASGGGRAEIWDYGLRNPWRFSFDRATGELFIGDVGQGAWEEIDQEPRASGGLRNSPPPILEYGHDSNGGFSVTGGYRYRGSALPALAGYYLYGDYVSGRI